MFQSPVEAWISLLYLGVVSQFLAYVAWYGGMSLGGISRVGQIQYLQPFMMIGFSVLFLGESITWLTIVLAVIVVGCVIVGTEIVEEKDSIDRFGVWFSNLSSSDQRAFTKKFEAIADDIHLLESMFSAIGKEFDQIAGTSSFPGPWDIGDRKGFDKMAKRIEILGKDFGGAMDFAKSHDAPNEIYSGLFSRTLNTFRLQLAVFENWYKLSGYLPDSANECQRTLIDVYEGLQHRVKETLLP